MAQSKGRIGKLYKCAIKRQFLDINYPNFENRCFTVFKWEDRVNGNKDNDWIERIGIISDTQRARVTQCLSNHMPSDIKKPSYESCMTAMRTEVHIVKYKSHPTGKIRNCLKFDEEVNDSVHVLYRCPKATCV